MSKGIVKNMLNSIESKISEALINNEISHEDFMTIINEERKYGELKESIRMMNSQRSETDKNNLTEESKKISIDEVIKRIEFINNSLKSKIYISMLAYCLNCRKNTKNINPEISKTNKGKI